MSRNAPKIGLIIALVIVVLLLIAVISATFVVRQNEYGVVYEFGAVVDVKDAPGLYFKVPFVQTASMLPKTTLLYDLPISDVITADKHSMVLDSFAQARSLSIDWSQVDPDIDWDRFQQGVTAAAVRHSRGTLCARARSACTVERPNCPLKSNGSAQERTRIPLSIFSMAQSKAPLLRLQIFAPMRRGLRTPAM